MSFVDRLLGNALEVDFQTLTEELATIMISGETVERGFKLVRDLFVFTNKRVVIVDKQGLTGRKKEFTSIPYKSITYFAMESAGTLDRDGEIKLWIKGSSTPIIYEIHKNISIENLCRTLSLYVLQ